MTTPAVRRFVRSPWTRYGFSKATWYRWAKSDPTLPKLYKLGPCAVGSDEDEIAAHQAALKSAATSETA
jgi:predicted DNA-binding transcriptional regulator AlpA